MSLHRSEARHATWYSCVLVGGGKTGSSHVCVGTEKFAGHQRRPWAQQELGETFPRPTLRSVLKMAARPTVNVRGIDGAATGSLPLPAVFNAPIRSDLVQIIHCTYSATQMRMCTPWST